MPMTTHCANCLHPKTYADLYEYNCGDCRAAVAEAEQYIAAEKLSASVAYQVKFSALASRREGTRAHKADPRLAFSPIDTSQQDAYLSNGLDPGEPLFDPRKIGR